jgi:hypothetical protein
MGILLSRDFLTLSASLKSASPPAEIRSARRQNPAADDAVDDETASAPFLSMSARLCLIQTKRGMRTHRDRPLAGGKTTYARLRRLLAPGAEESRESGGT